MDCGAAHAMSIAQTDAMSRAQKDAMNRPVHARGTSVIRLVRLVLVLRLLAINSRKATFAHVVRAHFTKPPFRTWRLRAPAQITVPVRYTSAREPH